MNLTSKLPEINEVWVVTEGLLAHNHMRPRVSVVGIETVRPTKGTGYLDRVKVTFRYLDSVGDVQTTTLRKFLAWFSPETSPPRAPSFFSRICSLARRCFSTARTKS